MAINDGIGGLFNNIYEGGKNIFNLATSDTPQGIAMRDYFLGDRSEDYRGNEFLQENAPDLLNYLGETLQENYGEEDNFNVGDSIPTGYDIFETGESGKYPFLDPGSLESIRRNAIQQNNPVYQAGNLFGGGNLTRTPYGYKFTGGTFDYTRGAPSMVEKILFNPIEYGATFDRSFNPIIQSQGNQALGQTLEQISNQQEAARNKNRGNYQAPTMTAQQIVQEAKDTGGTVNPFEVTQAAQNERNQNNQSGGGGSNQTSRPKNSPSSRPRGPNLRFRAQGGIVSINDMIGRM